MDTCNYFLEPNSKRWEHGVSSNCRVQVACGVKIFAGDFCLSSVIPLEHHLYVRSSRQEHTHLLERIRLVCWGSCRRVLATKLWTSLSEGNILSKSCCRYSVNYRFVICALMVLFRGTRSPAILRLLSRFPLRPGAIARPVEAKPRRVI